jgi:hypothetical protein
MRLSVIMPSLDCRQAYRERITKQIVASAGGYRNWELLTDIDDGSKRTIGEKMNRLKREAKGDYIVGVADDDEVAPNYLRAILDALVGDPDILTFDHTFSWKPGHKSPQLGWANGQRQCTLFHPLNAVARWLYDSWEFPHINCGEDKAFRVFVQNWIDKGIPISVKHHCEPLYHIHYRHFKPEFGPSRKTYNIKRKKTYCSVGPEA